MQYQTVNNEKNVFRRHLVLGVLLGCLVCSVLGTSAKAQWTGGIEGGTVVRDAGNATRLRAVLRNDARPLSHYLFAEWVNENSAGNSYSLGYNPRYWFNKTYYAFGESQFRTEELLRIDRELKLIGGLGSQLINEKNRSLYLEAGVGGRSITFDAVDDASNEGLALARAGAYQIFAEALKLDLSVSGTISSEEVSETNAEVGLSLRVPSGAVRIAYRSRSIKVGDAQTLTDDDTFISFNYGF